jgi:hypothetical protein
MRTVSLKVVNSMLNTSWTVPHQRRFLLPHFSALTTEPVVHAHIDVDVLVPARGPALGVDVAHF